MLLDMLLLPDAGKNRWLAADQLANYGPGRLSYEAVSQVTHPCYI